MAIPDRTRSYVYGLCGNRCAYRFQGVVCRAPIMTEQFEAASGRAYLQTLGDIAHIRGDKPGAARHDQAYGDPDVAPNLMLMCRPHHDQIDKVAPEHYSVQLLEQMRQEHIDSLVRDEDHWPQARAIYEAQIRRVEHALDLACFGAWTGQVNSAAKANIDRQFLRELEQWADQTLRTQLPSSVESMIEISRPVLEEELIGLAESVEKLVRSMRYLAEPAGDRLVESTAPWNRNTAAATDLDYHEQWHDGLRLLAEALTGIQSHVNGVIRAWRDIDPGYRPGEPDLRLG